MNTCSAVYYRIYIFIVCVYCIYVYTGLESVIGEMQPGGQATCSIPSKYAYGSKGN